MNSCWDMQADRQTNRQTDTQTERHTDTLTAILCPRDPHRATPCGRTAEKLTPTPPLKTDRRRQFAWARRRQFPLLCKLIILARIKELSYTLYIILTRTFNMHDQRWDTFRFYLLSFCVTHRFRFELWRHTQTPTRNQLVVTTLTTMSTGEGSKSK